MTFGSQAITTDIPTSFRQSLRYLLTATALLLFTAPVHAQLAAPNDTGVMFGHVHLNLTDMETHKSLWVDLFDGELIEKEGFTAVEVSGALIFMRERESSGPTAGTVMDHLGFAVRDIDAVLDEWRELGYDVDSEVKGENGLSKALITMPGGIRVELHENPGLSSTAAMSHVHLFTPEHNDLIAWYTDIFGAASQPGNESEVAAFIPGTSVIISHSDEVRAPTVGSVVDHIGYEVEDLAAFVEMLEEKGIELDTEPLYIERIDLWLAFFTDPSGVYIELTEGLDTY